MRAPSVAVSVLLAALVWGCGGDARLSQQYEETGGGVSGEPSAGGGGEATGGAATGGASTGGLLGTGGTAASSTGGESTGGAAETGGLLTGGAASASSGAAGDAEPGTGGSSQPPPMCEPGRQVSCPCVGGEDGVQSCRDDGSGWTPCECPAPPETGGTGGEGGAGGDEIPATETEGADDPLAACTDGLDEDQDGATDCFDRDCCAGAQCGTDYGVAGTGVEVGCECFPVCGDNVATGTYYDEVEGVTYELDAATGFDLGLRRVCVITDTYLYYAGRPCGSDVPDYST